MSSIYSKTKQLLPVAVVSFFTMVPSPVLSEENRLTFSVEAGIEYDDNISVSVLDATTGKSDEALVLDLSAAYPILEKEGQEIELSYDFYQSLHQTLDDFDLQIHTLSALGSWEINDLDTGLDYNYSRIYLGDDYLYNSHTLTPSLGFSGLENHYHRLSYSYLNKDFVSGSTRDAEQHSISADNYYSFMDSNAYLSLGLRLEEEDAKNPELDYQGIYLKLGASIPLPDVSEQPFKLTANYQHYWRDYDNVTVSIGRRRDDEQDLISIALIKPIYKNVDAKFSYEYTSTKSNLPSVDADENIFTLSFTVGF